MLYRMIHLLPGLLLAVGLAVVSLLAAEIPFLARNGFSALILAILGGMIVGNTLYGHFAKPCLTGIMFARHHLLRLGIVLFGFRITFQEIGAVGFSGILIAAVVVASTFFLALRVGKKYLGLDEQSVILIGAGSSICGAAAVLATDSVIKAEGDKVMVAVATVVVFGTLAMLLYPLAFRGLAVMGVGEFAYGVFAGSTLHEVAQALAAGHGVSETAARSAVITKMIRVMMLAPFLLLLSLWFRQRCTGDADIAQAPGKRALSTLVPWFVMGFLLMAGVNSLALLPPSWGAPLVALDNLLLATAMGALGLTTHASAIRAAGLKPLLLAAVLFVWLVLGGGLINVAVSSLLG